MVIRDESGKQVFGKEARKIEDARKVVTRQRALERDVRNQRSFEVTRGDGSKIMRTQVSTDGGIIKVDSTGGKARIGLTSIKGQQKIQAIAPDIKSFTIETPSMRRNVLNEKKLQAQRIVQQKRVIDQGKIKTQKVFLNVPSSRVIVDVFGKKTTVGELEARKKALALSKMEVERRKKEVTSVPFDVVSVSDVKSLSEKFSRNGDVDTAKRIVNLKRSGEFSQDVKKKFENKLKQQNEAIKKINAINKKTAEFNANYNKAVKPILKVLFPEDKKRGVELNFAGKVAKRIVREGSKLANPFIVGTEIASFLESFRVAKESGLTSIPKQFRKLKDPVKLAKNISAFAVSNFNPNTVEGLANIIIGLTILGLPKALIKGVARSGGSVLRTAGKGSEVFVNELKLTLEALARSKRASLRGARRVKARPSKVELRKRNIARQFNTLTRQQKKGFSRTKGEAKVLRSQARESLQRQRGVGKPLITVTEKAKEVPKVKPQPIKNVKQSANQVIVFDNKGRFVISVSKKFSNSTGKAISKPIIKAHKGIGDSVSNQISVTINKQSRRARRKALVKSKGKKLGRKERRELLREEAKIKAKKKSGGEIEKKVNKRIEDTLVNNKKPNANFIYEDMIVSPPDVLTRGWRSESIKNQVSVC